MTSPTEARLEILADPEALARRVAEWMLELAKNKNGVFSVCLSGGSLFEAFLALAIRSCLYAAVLPFIVLHSASCEM
jgi:hypothetical protein